MLKNITISLDENVLDAGRTYATAHHLSLNSLIRKVLAQTVMPSGESWMDEMFELMDQSKGNSHGGKWTRGEFCDV